MKLVSYRVGERASYGAVVGDGIVDLCRRFGGRADTLRAFTEADSD